MAGTPFFSSTTTFVKELFSISFSPRMMETMDCPAGEFINQYFSIYCEEIILIHTGDIYLIQMISSHDTCPLYLNPVCRAFKEQAARFKK